MRAWFFAGLLLASVAAWTSSARAELFSGNAPLVRIVYTAGSLGYLYPCAVCGGYASGGMARRATALAELARGTVSPLILAGPDEFYADRDGADTRNTRDLAQAQSASFAVMPYTAIYLSAPAASWLQHHKAALPVSGVPVHNTPVTRTFSVNAQRIGVVFFPKAAGPNMTPAPDQIDAVLAAARSLANECALVVGLSPWGMRTENLLMRRFAGSFHILMGAGEGPGVPGQSMLPGEALGPLWVRAESKGRSAVVLDLLALPGKDPGFQWIEGINFNSRDLPFGGSYTEDPAIKKLLRSVPQDIE